MKARYLTLALVALSAVPACAAGGPKVVAEIKGPDGYWDYASFDPLHRRILVGRSNGALALDVATGKLALAAPGEHVHAALPLPDGSILMTNGDANVVTLADGSSGKIRARIPVGRDPDAAIYDPAVRRAFVMNGDSGDVSVIDPETAKEDARIPVGGKLEGGATDGAGALFVNVADKAEVAVVDIKARRVRARFKLAGCTDPTAIAYLPAPRTVVSTCGNGTAKAIRAQDGREISHIEIGPHPDAALYDEARGRLFIATAGSLFKDGEVAVVGVDGQGRLSIVERIATQRGARTAAEDPRTERLYLPTATYALGLDGKPKPQPGTFKILVVQP